METEISWECSRRGLTKIHSGFRERAPRYGRPPQFTVPTKKLYFIRISLPYHVKIEDDNSQIYFCPIKE